MAGLMHQQKSVYNFLPEVEVHSQKPPRYTSKFRPTVVLEQKSNKDAMKTMGPSRVEPPTSDKYLKKHSKDTRFPKKPQSVKETHHSCAVRKPPVPARTDQPLMGIHPKKDFIKTATAVPMKPQPALVDTSKGHKQPLENSGLLPKFVHKKHYGEVPEYLQRRIEEERRAAEERDNYMKKHKDQGALKHIPDEERQAVLKGLKDNLDDLLHEYQGLPLVIDTIAKKAHKEHLEAAMKQLENDIRLFERFKTIYVQNN